MSYTVTIHCDEGRVHVTQLVGPNGRPDVELVTDDGYARMTLVQAESVSLALSAARRRCLGNWPDVRPGERA